MKYLFTFLLSAIVISSSLAQTISFESPWASVEAYELDSNGIWQVGIPNKNQFNTAYNGVYALITDSVNSYPINDTSSFILKQYAHSGIYTGYGLDVHIWGWYYANTDTLSDYLQIDMSVDGGQNWIDIIHDSILCDTLNNDYWYWETSNGLQLSGNTNGWKMFTISGLQKLWFAYDVDISDTVLYRFSFITDSIQTNKDGFMFDWINMVELLVPIERTASPQIDIHTYPNPATGKIYIHIPQIPNKENLHLGLYNLEGKLLREKAIPNTNESYQMDLQDLPRATYILQLRDQEGMILGTEKVIKT